MSDAFPIGKVLIGAIALLGDSGKTSAIHKVPTNRRMRATRIGFADDSQADLKHHGGEEKAIHHYPFDHYAGWREEVGAAPVLERPGAFGENLSTSGLTERDVSVGDVFRIGTATLQVSQGRQPCWKLNAHFQVEDMASRVQTSGRTGWYYRVLEEGDVLPGATLERIDRATPEWTIERLWRTLYVDRHDRDSLEALANLSTLSEGWRQLAARRAR
ncbi:MOSC domain-containing protein [Luteibacter yeojuensis]|uniref:MOSC domain-containing protein n=1 Tax=Luteibacter yeojuensis TaxID=345309 RepID=A0A7X5QSC6_9GAMM|nr:MOSC domain-containing protein [Luteibacter yeojuensis]NID14516.1 MOSC domain-containing protein [Luteibacter yeojuensis]